MPAPDRATLESLVEHPAVIAAAWAAWHARHGGRLGPGPAFVEAVAAGLRAVLALEAAGQGRIG